MENLAAEELYRLAMSPLYVLYLVASAHVSADRISERHIVRSMEYGLKWQTAFSEEVFDFARSNLHEIYADFPGTDTLKSKERWHAEIFALRQQLEALNVPVEMVDDFKAALVGLAQFVAEGGAFRQKLRDEPMLRRVAWIKETLDCKER